MRMLALTDFAFLQALHQSSGYFEAPLERGDIQDRVDRILASAPGEEL